MTEHKEKDIKFHADIAEVYDYLTVEPREFPNELLFKRIDKLVRPSDLMVDLGCGTGHMLVRHKDKFKRFIGVDHSREMLSQAQAKIVLSRDKFTFVNSDIEHYLNTYTGSQPDFVSIVGFLHHLEPQEITVILKKLYNFLVMGGQLLIAEPISSSSVPMLITLINGKSILNERLSEAMPPHTEDPDEEPLDENDLLKSIDEAGFDIKLIIKRFDVLHFNYPPKRWEKMLFKLISFYYGGNKGDVIALLAEKHFKDRGKD